MTVAKKQEINRNSHPKIGKRQEDFFEIYSLSHQSFKTERMISNNNFFDKPKQYQSSLSPNVCLPHNKSQPQLLNINYQKVQYYQYTVFALLADWVTLALLFFLTAFAVKEMAFSNTFCCLSVNSFLFCPTSFRRESLRKASNWSFLT